MKNRANAAASLASLRPDADPAEFQFERPEWTLFRSVSTLPQKAGVPIAQLRRLVLKEAADNGLDADDRVWLGRLDDMGDRCFVKDDGPGIDPDAAASLLSRSTGATAPTAHARVRRRCILVAGVCL